jgi:ATP-dependent DNA ligase
MRITSPRGFCVFAPLMRAHAREPIPKEMANAAALVFFLFELLHLDGEDPVPGGLSGRVGTPSS